MQSEEGRVDGKMEMDRLFQNMLKAEESLFIDAIALDFDYLPKFLPHRENQQKYLAECIAPLLQNRSGKNLLITGKSGIGKTAAVKWVLRELEEKFDEKEIKPIYINCWKKDTTFKILVEICGQIGYKFVQNKRSDELLGIVTKRLNDKAVVFAFDEVDKLDDFSILYSIVEDINRKTIFLITNEKGWYANNLDQRIRSRLTAEHLEFPLYSYDETSDILRQRRDFAFVNGCWEEDAFESIAKKSVELEDLRSGLSLLKEAGEIAEGKSSRKIRIEHAIKSIEKFDVLKIRKSTDLAGKDKELLDFLKAEHGKCMMDLFGLFNKRFFNKGMKKNAEENGEGISYRTFQRQIKRLKDSKMIRVEEKATDKGKVFVVNVM